VLVGGALLQDVELRALEPNVDERGSFTEVFAAHWSSDIAPVQWSVVASVTGALRGMHLHRRHGELVTVVHGRLSVGLYDARPGSPTEGCWARYELAADAPASLCFPAGFVHGWLAHEPTTHLQAVSEAYADYAEDDNLGCHWADPDLGIEWPFEPTVVAPRAAAFPSLRDLREQVQPLGEYT
jgi:dTDP-4-dehydrorhamnose 3,5-epimerase